MTSLVLAYFGFICVLSTTFNCSEDSQCASQNLKCDDDEDCFIFCTGYQSCQSTTFTCPKSNSANVNVSCNVICGDGTTISAQTCYSTTIDAYYSDLFSLNINGVDGQRVQYGMKITCPCDGKCNIDCDSSYEGCRSMTVNAEQTELTITSTGELAYYFMQVRAEYASKLTMTGSGSQSFYSAYIYCPQTENGNPKCNLEYTGDYEGFLWARIYAINSFWDLNMICNGPEGFSTEQCYYYSTSTDGNPRMYCLSDYSQNCVMTTDDGINWVCTDSTNICAVTPQPTESPTDSPTKSPTHPPTNSPNSIPTRLSGSSSTVIVLSVVVAVLVIIIVVGSLLHCRRMKNVKSKKFVEIKENYQSVNEKPQDYLLSSIQLE